MSDPRFQELDALVRARQRFVLSTHVNPDGDGLGSEVAFALYLRGLGKDVHVLNDGKFPPNFEYLNAHFPLETFTPERAEALFARAEVLAVFDMQNRDRLGRLEPYLGRPGLTVVILDHHVGNAAFGHLNLVYPEAAATGELVYDFIRRDPQGITRPIAEALYTALVTDTGSFRHSNTDPEAHAMAGALLERGVQSAVVQSWIYQVRQPNRLRFLGHLLQDLRLNDDGTVAWFEVPQTLFGRYGVEGSDTEGLVDFPRTLPGVEAVVLFTELPGGQVKVSMRSSGRVDVNAVAHAFAGGGHRFAAGATVAGSLPEARDKVLARLREAIARLEPAVRPAIARVGDGGEPARAAGG